MSHPRTVAMLVGALVSLACARARESPLAPNDQPAAELTAVAAARAELDQGVEALERSSAATIAKRHAEAGLTLLRRHGLLGSYSAAKLYRLLGRAEHRLGAFSLARSAFQRELEILKGSGAPLAEVARALTHLAATYSGEKDYPEAERTLNTALGFHSKAREDPLGTARTLGELANVCVLTNRTERARALVGQALVFLVEPSEETDRQIFVLEMIRAEASRYDQNLEGAVAPFLAAARATGGHEGALSRESHEALERLSQTYWALGRKESAVLTRDSGLSFLNRNRGVGSSELRAISDLAEWYRQIDRADAAKDVYARFHVTVRTLVSGEGTPLDGEPERAFLEIKVPPGKGGPAPTTGTLSNAAKIVASMRPAFRACYQRALDRDPHVEGNILIRIRVAADGAAKSATGYTLNVSADLVDCALSRAGKSQFDPPEGGAAIVNVPVNLVRAR